VTFGKEREKNKKAKKKKAKKKKAKKKTKAKKKKKAKKKTRVRVVARKTRNSSKAWVREVMIAAKRSRVLEAEGE
jgi:predicted Zn-dependent protease